MATFLSRMVLKRLQSVRGLDSLLWKSVTLPVGLLFESEWQDGQGCIRHQKHWGDQGVNTRRTSADGRDHHRTIERPEQAAGRPLPHQRTRSTTASLADASCSVSDGGVAPPVGCCRQTRMRMPARFRHLPLWVIVQKMVESAGGNLTLVGYLHRGHVCLMCSQDSVPDFCGVEYDRAHILKIWASSRMYRHYMTILQPS